MSRVIPSQAVALIDQIYPWAANPDSGGHELNPGASNSSSVAVIVDIVEQIPSELLTDVTQKELR
jgi:hypothetical protein